MKRFFAIYIALFVTVVVYGQSSTAGKDFWFSFGNNNNQSYNDVTLQIHIISTKKTDVHITFMEKGNSLTIPLYDNMYKVIILTKEQKEMSYSKATGNASIHITADTEDIFVHAVNVSKGSTEAAAVLPTDFLDRSYYHLSYPSSNDGYTIVAVEDNTIIYQNGVQKASLNRGQIYSSYFHSESDSIGRQITSNKKIAYFVTNACADIPSNIKGCECLYEQLYPEKWWGRHFFVPVTIRGKERVRVFASQNNTVIYTDGTYVSGSPLLNAGEWVEIETNDIQNGCHIKATQPVSVASYLTEKEYGGLTYSPGAPAMTWIPPVEQTVKEIGVAPFSRVEPNITKHFLLITVPTLFKDSTKVRYNDGAYKDLTGGVWRIHSSGYSYYNLPLESLSVYDHYYNITNPEGLTAYAYGLGENESYYYLAGSTPLEDTYFKINEVNYQDFKDTLLCNGDIKVEAVINYKTDTVPGYLRWQIDGVEQSAYTDSLHWVTHLLPGEYTVSMIVNYKYLEPDTLTTSFVVGKSKETTINDTICQLNPYNKYNFSLSVQRTAGMFTHKKDTVTTLGCDSIVYLNLLVNPTKYTVIKDTVCLNEPYKNHGFKLDSLKTPGLHTDSLVLSLPCAQCCDSIIRLELYVDARRVLFINDTICLNESYEKFGFSLPVQTTAGTFDLPPLILPAIQSCDSIINLTLTVEEPVSSTTLASICDGDSYLFYDTYYTAAGIYTHYISPCSGSDTLVLTVNPTYETEMSVDIFSGDDYPFNGCSYTKEGTYTNTLKTVHGCDSVFIIRINEINIPNTFTPNGDGANDIFMPDVQIWIYNRNGLLLYNGKDGWDGTYKGNAVLRDTYFYIMNYSTASGEKTKKGYVTLIR